jgi:AcrR family transcriptional regulator
LKVPVLPSIPAMSQRFNNETKDRSSDTRLRLLDAAGHAFAEFGFRDATVRDICKRAGANVAAVNYHFGDKERLYSAAIEHWVRQSFQKFPPNMGVSPHDPPEQRLRAFVRALLMRTIGSTSERMTCHTMLLVREMVDPTSVLSQQFEITIKPMFVILDQIVSELSDGTIDQVQRRSFVWSIMGQSVFYHHCRAVLDLDDPQQSYGPEQVDRLADHITRFSVAGIRELTGTSHQAAAV